MISWTVVFTFFVALCLGVYIGFRLGVESCWAYLQQQMMLARARRLRE